MKINFLTNIPSPYRVNFFNLLAKKSDLTVIYERISSIKRNQDWFSSKIEHNYLLLKGFPIRKESVISLSLIKYFFNIKFQEIFVIGGYSTASGLFSWVLSHFSNAIMIVNFDGIKSSRISFVKELVKKILLRKKFFYLVPNSISKTYLINLGISEGNIFKYRFSSLYNKDFYSIDYLLNAKNEHMNRSLRNKNKKFRIITVSRFDLDKGYDIFIKVALTNSNHQFVFVGEKPSDKILAELNSLNINNIVFLGFLSKSELFEEFIISDLYLTTSRVDPWNLSVVEAMSMMLPVISTPEVGASAELIKNGFNGSLVEQADYEGFNKEIEKYSKDNEIVIRHGINAFNTAISYSIENMVDDHLKSFHEIISKLYHRSNF
jgi:glycosyltransferase involved in cell wall biosynthesis